MTTATVTDLNLLAGQTFGTIYADPPWRYENTAARGAAARHYDGTMTVDEICALPVDQLAAPDAHLYLWTTNSFIFECAKIFDAWGFEHVGAFHWCKPTMGTGNYWRNAHETILIGIRPGAALPAEDMPAYMLIPRGRHSAKPEQVRRMIETYSPPGPRLELFGRSPAAGWTVWGNQIDCGLLFHHMVTSHQSAALG